MTKSYQLILLLFIWSAASILVSCTESPTPAKAERPVDLIYQSDQYIARCLSKCEQLAVDIRAAGGNIRRRYVNINAIAFDLNDQSSAKNNILAKYPVFKDRKIAAPVPVEKMLFANPGGPLVFSEMTIDKIGQISLQNYAFNNNLTGAAGAHQQNNLGQDIIVAIIDSGTANSPEIVSTLSGAVIGGENFVPTEPTSIEAEPSATSTLNDDHGTWVGTMIAGHAGLVVDKSEDLAQAVLRYAPGSILPVSDTEIEVPIIGSAPGAKIYALKTFGFDGGGASSSTIIAAMDRVLTLKTNFNNGVPSEPIEGDGSENKPFVFDSLNIQVLNMSLGGPALFPGNEIEDLLSDALVSAGVVVVASAGNEGFAAMTGGSPGTGVGSISVGAANDATHERILRELQEGVGLGIQYRPTAFLQIAHFSSRGPTADGRNGVDLIANGMAAFVQGADGSPGLVSGTSFSSPTVAGAAALLWNAFPTATALQIKTALIKGANPKLLPATTSQYDQGHGFLDVHESLEILEEGELNNKLPTEPLAKPNSKVLNNIQKPGMDILSILQMEHSADINLQPGQVKQFFIETDKNTTALKIEIEDFLPALPPEQQNTLFTDDLIITVVDSPLSLDETRLFKFIDIGEIFVIDNPQHGLVRLAIMGDWTNIGNVSAEVSIERIISAPNAVPAQIAKNIVDGDSHQYEFIVDSSITTISLNLSWLANWAFYPSHDIDLLLIDPEDTLHFEAATLASPERVTIEAPITGTWTVIVDGFLLHDMQGKYELSVRNQNNVPILLTPLVL